MSLYFLQSYEEILTNEKKNRKKIKKTHESESFLEVRGGVEPPWPVLQTGD